MFPNNNHANIINEQKILEKIRSVVSISFEKLAKSLKLSPKLNKQLTLQLKKLINKNLIEINRDDKYIAIYFLTEVECEVVITNKRLGFIEFEENGEKKSAFIPPFQLKNCLDKDIIKANIFYYFSDSGEKLYKANVLKNVKHNKKIIVGTITKTPNNHFYFDACDEKHQGKFEFLSTKNIPDSINKNDIVKCEILASNDKNILILYKQKISNLNDSDFPVKKIIASNDVNESFDDETIKNIDLIPNFVSEEEIKERKDLRELLTVTIDGLDTKDFDDAISCYKQANNNWKLFIHIADVSYYVKENSPIDVEALKRGTSIYLPDAVIPMLPFQLSNGICSLNPDEVRNCITLELEIDGVGDNINAQLYASTIKSNYRLTYNEVNDYFDNKINVPQKISLLLDAARDLSNIIGKKKANEGYVDFEIKEPKIIIENEKVIDIKIIKEGESEKLIENFMVRANETVTQLMLDRNIPSIYRIHEKPSEEKLLSLQSLLKFSGYKNITVPLDGKPLSFANMINQIKKISFDDYLKMAMLRTMQKAIYSSNNIGHFGLASEAYSHFTSPIRRYPDLLLHRLIRKYIFEKRELKDDDKKKLGENIELIALLNSESEKIAMTIERDIVDIKKAEFFENLINKTFDATLVSVEKFGCFFNINKYETSVLIRFENINDNILKISDYEAKGNKISLKVGKNYKLIITSVEKEKGNINAMLA
ncbi:ribonuclease R [Metamycoplasma equirhinis]|uniref:ribonuclease R n=1 Tax=Metamycoplasma equirhinis TaxID=92402 RepID=UPI00359308C3